MTPLSVPERVLQGLGITDPDDIDLEAIAWTMGAGVATGRWMVVRLVSLVGTTRR